MRKAGLGIDIGNGSISIAVVEGENIIYKDYRLHRGELYQNLVDMLGQMETSCVLAQIADGIHLCMHKRNIALRLHQIYILYSL